MVEQYSKEFEDCFPDVLQRHHNTKRTHANLVYKEMIADKFHVHMNATKFDTLTTFVLYLGKTGKVVADETEGWYVTWIDRDPAVVARQAEADRSARPSWTTRRAATARSHDVKAEGAAAVAAVGARI